MRALRRIIREIETPDTLLNAAVPALLALLLVVIHLAVALIGLGGAVLP